MFHIYMFRPSLSDVVSYSSSDGLYTQIQSVSSVLHNRLAVTVMAVMTK